MRARPSMVRSASRAAPTTPSHPTERRQRQSQAQPSLRRSRFGVDRQGAAVLRGWQPRSSAEPYGVGKEIDAHAQSRLALIRGIVVNLGIFPSISQVRLVRVVHYEAAVEEDAKALRRLFVMGVNLGEPAGKVVYQMVDGVIEWNLNQRFSRKQPGQLPPDRRIHSVVVVSMEEPSLLEKA